MRDPIEIWDDLLHDVAEQVAEDGTAAEDDIRWSLEVDAMVRARLAALRRQLTPAYVPVKRGVAIPPEIQALDRAALMAQLERLRADPNVRYAHEDLRGLTDKDLRTLLTVLLDTGRK
ncbi:MAG TPA: hypothetical protein VFT22_36310 [Kofleriaceae bacterium]|nr:hypothetical protein [Kofleriaceae bacterium]